MFQNGVYVTWSWLINGKGGTGDTPIERLLSMIFSLWYIASILPVIMAPMSSSSEAMQWAILTPLFFHIFSTINIYLYGDSWKVINADQQSSMQHTRKHAFITLLCLVLLYKASYN